MKSVPFPLKERYLGDRDHSYVVDAWLGGKGWPDLNMNECTVPREWNSLRMLCGEANVGEKRARKGVEWLYDHGWLRNDDRGGLIVEIPREPPYISLSGKMATNLARALNEDQMRAFLWLANKKKLASLRREECAVAPIWLVRELGLSECSNNRARVNKTIGELEDMGLVVTRPARYGNMTVVTYAASEWDQFKREEGEAAGHAEREVDATDAR